jgi:hypothetical protein
MKSQKENQGNLLLMFMLNSEIMNKNSAILSSSSSYSSSSSIRASGLLRFHSIFLTVFLGFFFHVVCSSCFRNFLLFASFANEQRSAMYVEGNGKISLYLTNYQAINSYVKCRWALSSHTLTCTKLVNMWDQTP